MSYTDVFGGSTVQASDVQFRAVALSASIVTVWPPFATSGNECARIMQVTPSAGSLTVTLPDARLTSAGMDVLFDNPSATTFTVLDAAGGVVATIAGGEVKYFYLSDSSTAAGTWRVTLFGVGSSSVDAAQLAGYGLKALTNTLNIAAVVTTISVDTTVTPADRSKVFVWTGGSGTLTLPTTSGSTSDYAIEVHNQGSGTLTIATTGGVLIDDSATITLIVTESCFLHMGATDWYTVGRGRNTQFNFTQLNKSVTGGTVDLTLTEASNVVQTYTGALLSNQIVNQPAVVQVYYVSNATTGAYTLTFGCIAGGTSVVVTQGQAAILFCDGTNVINANTSLSGGVSAIIFAAASAAAPSAAFATSSTGFYAPAANEIGVSNNGVYTGKFTSGGYRAETTGAAALQAISSGAAASLIADRPAGSIGSARFRTGGSDRWALETSAVAESGTNAGSNFAVNSYDDAGALLGTVFTIVRSTQVATFTQPPVLAGTNITGTASGLTAGSVTTNANLTGEVTSVGNAATLTNSAVIGKVLTGYSSGAGTVAATDSILQAINKLNGNVALKGVGDVTLTGTQTLTNKTLTGYTETVYALSGTVIDPANGTIQTKTLSGATTFTESLADGQSVILGITAGAHAVTWPTTVWAKVGGGGAAPTLVSSGVNWITLWQTGGTLRGSFLGTA